MGPPIKNPTTAGFFIGLFCSGENQKVRHKFFRKKLEMPEGHPVRANLRDEVSNFFRKEIELPKAAP